MSPPTKPLTPQATTVLRQFRLVLSAVKSHFQQVEKQVGIGGAQVWALSVLTNQPDIGTTALATSMDIHQSTASNLIKSLVAKGLVVATRDEIDRRAVHLRVTEEGRQLLARAPGPSTGLLPQALNHMDATQLERLSNDLTTLISLMGNSVDPLAAQQPLANL